MDNIYSEVPSLEQLMAIKPNLKAILFDMDGTLLNSEVLHAKACFKLFTESGRKRISLELLEDLRHDLIGKCDPEVMSILKQRELVNNKLSIQELVEEKNTILMKDLKSGFDYEQCLAKEMELLLTQISQSTVTQAVVTASEGPLAHQLLDEFQLTNFFSFIITRASTPLSKPHPDPYLFAKEKLGLDDTEILIVEDSPTGIEAAEKSGIDYIVANWYKEVNLSHFFNQS